VAEAGDSVTWDAFWKLMGVFGVLLAGAWTVALSMINGKANKETVKNNREDIDKAMGMAEKVDGMMTRLNRIENEHTNVVEGLAGVRATVESNTGTLHRLEERLDNLIQRGGKNG
jgi:DNA repair ATPase RecN